MEERERGERERRSKVLWANVNMYAFANEIKFLMVF